MSKEMQDISVSKLVRISQDQNAAMESIKEKVGINQSRIIRHGIDLAIKDYTDRFGENFGFNFEGIRA